MSTPETGENDLTYFTEILDFIKFRFYILFGIAVLVMIAAYFGTVIVAKRKRGMI